MPCSSLRSAPWARSCHYSPLQVFGTSEVHSIHWTCPFRSKEHNCSKAALLTSRKKHPFSSVTLRTSPVAALDVLSQWLTLSGQENKQENRVTRKKVKPWKVKKAACLEDNSRAANDGQEKSCHFQSCQGRGKPCRHRVIILKVLRLGRIMTAVFVMHVNMGKELRRALASPGFGQQRGEGKRGCWTGCVVHPCAAATQPGVEGLCHQPEG